jgi:hypothetical protein
MPDPFPGSHQHGHPHALAQKLVATAHWHAAQPGRGDDGPAVGRALPKSGAEATDSGAELSASKLAHADKHKCSACASCCSAALIGNTVLRVPAPEVTPTVFNSVVPTVEKFSSSGPDRPPRVLVV